MHLCRPRLLTPTQAAEAVRRSIEINPANLGSAEAPGGPAGPAGVRRGGQRRLAVLVARRWPLSGIRLTVQFLDNPSKPLRARILQHMNAWSQSANVGFEETSGTGMVRIARLDQPAADAGYWSYIGTEILGIEADQPTMNLDGFTMRTPESEFLRVVRHETGHTLGFEHEHMRTDLVRRIDRRKAIAYFRRTEDWTEQETIEQVLTPLAKASLMGTTESDPLSIMCYEIPGEITKDHEPIVGGSDINPRDHAFAAKVYPKGAAPRPAASAQAPAAPRPASTAEAEEALHIVVMDGFESGSGIAPDTARFARVFASYAGARVTMPLRLRAAKGEEATAWGRIIGTHEAIKNYTNRERGALPDDARLLEFGSRLFDTLFQGDVRRLYDEARARRAGRRLDLVFTSMIPWIAEKPWEFAYDKTRRSFLATEDIHFVRNVLTAIPADRIAQRAGPLRILVMAAQPLGLAPLSATQETEVVRRGFDALIEAGLAQVEVLPRATPHSIHAALETGRFDVAHFIGHGSFDDETQQGALMFEDERGGSYPLGERSVREIFCQRGLQLVFLNACQSGSGGRADFNKGIAQALVAHGLPALVANQYSVLDNSATAFAQHFYWALAQGMGIGEAAREARIAVNYSMHGDPIDWAVPVVYARDPAMALCLPAATANLAPPQRALPAARGAGRQQAKGRLHRVAVWDIDNVFPALDSTLQRMNEAQEVFGFELVDLSSPIDAWDLDQRAPDGSPYLRADRLAQRLLRATVDLRVNLLTCITRHWMSDAHTANLYGWWPPDGKPPVAVLSCAGLGLEPEGEETDRALANCTVTALAGFLGRLPTHEGHAQCPMATNAERELRRIAGRQAFDAACRARLKKALPSEFPALEALLKTFH